jgi:hypothetical protein
MKIAAFFINPDAARAPLVVINPTSAEGMANA